MMKRIFLIVTMTFLGARSLNAQDTEGKDLNQQAANPIANLMSFPFQNNTIIMN